MQAESSQSSNGQQRPDISYFPPLPLRLPVPLPPLFPFSLLAACPWLPELLLPLLFPLLAPPLLTPLLLAPLLPAPLPLAPLLLAPLLLSPCKGEDLGSV